MTQPTDPVFYHQGELHMESCQIRALAEKMTTPFFCYSEARLLDNVRRCKDAFESRGIRIHYAMKANSTLHVLRLLAEQGLGVDLVSGGEMQRALAAGFVGQHMILSGVGKTITELNAAIETGVSQFNVESAEELALLTELAEQKNVQVSVALRVNPDVKVNTHKNITTGQKGNKFGIDMEQVAELTQLYAGNSHLIIEGLAIHIGSQICDTEPYRIAVGKMMNLVEQLEQEGVEITRLDLGGGFGIDYGQGTVLDFETIAEVISIETQYFKGTVIVEPGRSLVADTGVLVSRINYVKKADPRTFVILDAGMNDLMRPALYQAVHPLVTVAEPKVGSTQEYDIVGPICESTDTFVRDYPLSDELRTGDLVVFLYTGAYCSVMNSSYNSRSIIPEIMVNGSKAKMIRRPITQEKLMAFEQNVQELCLV
ncbi:diaminopimelate decarboxylase [Vibrio inusitatus NBRC 102082]|uniref:Diaminopimelate decarboxylase n=1 Tax=Vibrio inusitatus NBRC 102082 TaxID=1219070 RepID=A0A4Y3HYM3_9VIBR|nr:diaminopimelate decarboxylase [Vibrio inusitatus]GEA52279.1 diaminopimelate decarboxylase [Vibrio inusitatus NBRC 102082]